MPDTSTALYPRLVAAPAPLRLTLGVFAAAIAFSLGGILLIQHVPGVMAFFGPYFETLVKIPTWTYMATLPVIAWLMYEKVLGPARMAAVAAAGIMIGGGSELLGTMTGFPFGEYGYTDWLGPKLAGHVPYFIPLSWFAMTVVSYDLASRLPVKRAGRIAATAAIMTLWDVSLDPAMSRAFPFWAYGSNGFFYGMPLTNWLGWFLVSATIAAAIELVAANRPLRSKLAPEFYFLNCFFPFALSFIYGLVGAALVGVIATALVLLTVRRLDDGTRAV